MANFADTAAVLDEIGAEVGVNNDDLWIEPSKEYAHFWKGKMYEVRETIALLWPLGTSYGPPKDREWLVVADMKDARDLALAVSRENIDEMPYLEFWRVYKEAGLGDRPEVGGQLAVYPTDSERLALAKRIGVLSFMLAKDGKVWETPSGFVYWRTA